MTIVSAGSPLTVSSGQTVSGTIIQNGGSLTINSGGVAVGTTNSGGYEFDTGVDSGGAVSAGGQLYVQSGGVANATIVSSGGIEIVSGTASGVTVLSGGEIVYAGGKASAVTLNNGGIAYYAIVPTGVTVSGVAVDSRFSQTVSGGTSINAIVSGAYQIVTANSVASGTTILSGGFQTLNSVGATNGGIASNTTISDGGTQIDQYIASGTTISSGGVQQVSGGQATNNFIMNGGLQTIFYGTATNTVISSGGLQIISGGAETGVTVLSGGEIILAGGTVSGLTVSSGGIQLIEVVSSGVTASGNVISNNPAQISDPLFQTISSGGTAINTTLISAVQTVLSGGIASGATLIGATQTIQGGTAIQTTLSGSFQSINGGVASGTVIGSGGSQFLYSGLITDATIGSGGFQNIVSGTATGTVIGSGGVQTLADTVSGTIINNGGEQDVYSGGTANGTVIASGGLEVVSSGGIASGTTVQSGGKILFAGGTVAGLTVGVGGLEAIAYGATASGLTVSSGITLVVSSGATAVSATVLSGGQIVFAGGTASGLTVSGGGIEAIGSGATLETTSAGAGVTVLFTTSQGTLILDNPATFAGVISNLAQGNLIDLRGVTATTATLSGNVLSVKTSTGSIINLNLQSSIVGSTFSIASDGVGGSTIAPTASTASQYTTVGSGVNFLGAGEQDSFVRTSAGQLAALQFNSAGQVVNSQAFTYNGSPTAFDPNATVVGVGSNYFGGSERDIFFRTSNGQLNIWEFTVAGQLVGAQALTYNGIPTAFDPNAVVVGVGSNYFGGNERDVFFRTSNGQLNLWEFTAAGQLIGAQAFVYNTVPTVFDPTATVVGLTSNYFGGGEHDVFFRTSNGQLNIWEFTAAGQLIGAQAFVYNTVPTVFDPTAMVVGTTTNYFGNGEHDVFFRTGNGQLNIWEFTAGGQLVGAQAFVYNTVPTAFDPNATVVGVTTNYFGSGEHDVFFRTGNGQLNIWEFTAAGQLIGSQAFAYNTVPTAFDQTATVVGVTTNYSGGGEHDVFFRTGSGQLNIWEFTAAGQLVGSQAFAYKTIPTAFDLAAAVVGTTTNYSGAGEHDVFFRTGNGQLNIWEFTAAGQLVGAQAFVYGSIPTAFDPTAAVVGVGTNFSGGAEHDVFFRTGSGQLNIWEFNAAGQLVGSLPFASSSGGAFIVSSTATVTSAGHDSVNGKSALLLQANGQSTLYDLTGSALSVAPISAFLDPLVLNLTGGAVQTTSQATSGVTFDMQGDGSQQQTGWITQGEGFLVADPSGAPIVSRAQMFSDLLVPGAGSGLAALATYDTNGDGKITAADADFKNIDVWVPGSSGAVTLYTLDQLGIAEIDLQKTAIDALNNGNEILNGFSFRYADGASGHGAEVGFAAGANIDTTGAALSQMVQAMASLTPIPALTTVANPLTPNDSALQNAIAPHS